MAKGGARTRSGPPPDPNALRRHGKGDSDWLLLPTSGREGDAPDWPLDPEANSRERSLWSSLWSKPQAVAWESNGVELEVALYVRRLCEAERPGSPTNLSTLVRQLSDSLGLSTVGLRSNRWKIGEVAASDTSKRGGRRSSTASRERLQVIEGGNTS
jgi:hypothetical protein